MASAAAIPLPEGTAGYSESSSLKAQQGDKLPQKSKTTAFLLKAAFQY